LFGERQRGEGVFDAHPLDLLTLMEIFGQELGGMALHSSCHDQRIPKGELVRSATSKQLPTGRLSGRI
jgi:hypothetical protein